jgi:hypothetical protein
MSPQRRRRGGSPAGLRILFPALAVVKAPWAASRRGVEGNGKKNFVAQLFGSRRGKATRQATQSSVRTSGPLI